MLIAFFLFLHFYIIYQDAIFLHVQISDLSHKLGLLLFNKKTQAEIKINFACLIIQINLLNNFMN